MDGHQAAERMVAHSFNTFSHHNSFWPYDTEATGGDGNPRNKSGNIWMTTALNANFIREARLPLTDACKTLPRT